MKCVGITSPRDIAILLNIGPEYLEFLFERIESRWTIKIKTTIENEENFFLFGLKVEEVEELKAQRDSLLDACREALGEIEYLDSKSGVIGVLRQAITKAEGR